MTRRTGKPKVVTYRPANRLADLVVRRGGVSRAAAIEAAERNVEAMRESFLAILDELVAELEVAAMPGRSEAAARLAEIEKIANRIITLAGTYGLAHLTEAAKRLCDLILGLPAHGLALEEAIALHVRAVRLFRPGNIPPEPQAAHTVLQELHRVLEHFGIAVPPEPVLPGEEPHPGPPPR